MILKASSWLEKDNEYDGCMYVSATVKDVDNTVAVDVDIKLPLFSSSAEIEKALIKKANEIIEGANV